MSSLLGPASRRSWRWLVGAAAIAAAVVVVLFAVARAPADPADEAIRPSDQATTGANGSAIITAPAIGGTDGAGASGEEAIGPPTVDGQSPAEGPGGEGGGDGGTTTTVYDGPGIGVLPTSEDGSVVPQTTPPHLVDRQLATVDTLPPPSGIGFVLTDEPLEGESLARSTWQEECPVRADELRYLTATFWGFDGQRHQGELVVHDDVANDMSLVLEALYEAQFPMEEMRIVTQADIDAPPTGDGNNTATFACRPVTGGSRFSEHAYGLAIDINPFQNPYLRDDIVLPELATSYLDRDQVRPGMILEGDVVVNAFDSIGWGWGGRWSSLKDYQHFSLNDR